MKKFKRLSLVLLILLLLQHLAFPLAYAAGDADGVNVNFQEDVAPVPDDYIPDFGETYGSRNGYTYGWNTDHTEMTVTHATYEESVGGYVYGEDPEDSYIRFENGGFWEMEVDNGYYDVEVTVGDAVYGSENTVFVEGVSFFEDLELDPGEWEREAQTVQVSDGRITLNQGGAFAAQTALASVRIEAAPAPPVDTDLPYIGPPPEARNQTGNKVLVSGNINNKHNAPPYIRVEGLQEEIDRYMSEQIQQVEQAIVQYAGQADTCANCDASDIQDAIAGSGQYPYIVQTGHWNMGSDATFGSPDEPGRIDSRRHQYESAAADRCLRYPDRARQLECERSIVLTRACDFRSGYGRRSVGRRASALEQRFECARGRAAVCRKFNVQQRFA